MHVVVCTLFEKSYHLGVAVLVNSLTRAGFRGPIVAGFRGPLPPWASHARAIDGHHWELVVPDGPTIHFARLETSVHFTNYKPEFMLGVLDAPETDAVLYFDPDLVVDTSWRFLEDWLTCGLTVCEDVNSPVPENHPHRVGWRRFFAGSDTELHYRGSRYANGGLLGVTRDHRVFLETWRQMLAEVLASLGGSDVVGIGGGRILDEGTYGFANCFNKTDQDALNAAIEACPHIPVSFLNKQAMGFDRSVPQFPHALGPRKPWNRHFLREALDGRPPARVDQAFWRAAGGPLWPFSPAHLRLARLRLALAAGLGRIVHRI